MKLLILSLFVSAHLFAQVMPTPKLPTEDSEVMTPAGRKSEVKKVVEEAKPIPAETQKVEEQNKKSADYREETFGTVMVGYQLVASWIPSKKTLSYTQNFNRKWSLEGEYSWSSVDVPSIAGIDLGEIKEKRYTLQARRFVGNSFHFSFGAAYNDFFARVGSDILDRLGNEIKSSFRAQNLGATLGLGNRWQWGNGFTLGVDWIRLNVPVFETAIKDNLIKDIADSDDQTDTKQAIRTVNRLPTFVLLGLNLGYSF